MSKLPVRRNIRQLRIRETNKKNEDKRDEIMTCPFIDQPTTCSMTCRDCEVRIKAMEKVAEQRQIADNMESYWMHLADGAER